MGNYTSIAIVLPALFFSLAYVITTIARTIGRSRRERYHAEVQNKLIDRLGTGADALAFMQSDAARNLLAGPVDAEQQGGYAGRVLGGLQVGLILLCGGAGMFAAAAFATTDGVAFLRIVGMILMAVGFGSVLSAGWSFLLLKKWGLLESRKEQ